MKRTSLVLFAALIVLGCKPPPVANVPWDSDTNGGVVIYHTDYGEGFCAGAGCPTRIVQIGTVCVTETWSGTWDFRESKPCADLP